MRKIKEHRADLLPLVLFLAITLFITWPLMLRFGSSIYGEPGDNVGAVWQLWWLKNAARLGGTASFCPLLGYPFGKHLALPIEAPSYALARLCLFFMDEIHFYNLDILMSFFLSGVTMYLLARHLTCSRKAALFGGLVYLVAPYHVFHSMTIGGGIAATQWMPLYILCLLRFIEEPRLRSAVLLAISSVLVSGTSAHYFLFMAVFTVAFLAGRFICRVWQSRHCEARVSTRGFRIPAINKKTLLLALFVILIVVASTMPFYTAGLTMMNPPGRWSTWPVPSAIRFDEYVQANAANPLKYFKPSSASLLFRATGIEPSLKKFNYDDSLYIGWSVILLAAFGILGVSKRTVRGGKGAMRSLKAENEHASSGAELPLVAPDLSYVAGFATAAAVSIFLSTKPYLYVGATRIPMPSVLFRLFVPWFRWYLRLGVVVLICFIVLACYGLKFLMEKRRGLLKTAFFAGISVLMILELLIVPPFRNYRFDRVPEVFRKVAGLPDGSAVAFYPLRETGLFVTNNLIFFQRYFKKPMINDAGDNSDGEALRRSVANPFNPQTPCILRRFGIDYLVFFRKQFREIKGKGDLESYLPGGLELISSFEGKGEFSDALLFRITAPKAELVPLYLGEITVPVLFSSRKANRLLVGKGEIRILNFKSVDARASLVLPIRALFTSQTVVIRAGKRAVFERTLRPKEEAEAVIADLLIPPGSSSIEIETSGRLTPMSSTDISWFGAPAASLILGEVRISST